MFLEREQTGEPATVAGLQQEIKALKERCGQCGVGVPPFKPEIVGWFGDV